MEPILLSISQFCDQCSIGRTKAYELLKQGKIEAVKVGTRTLIRVSSIEEWLEQLPPRETEPWLSVGGQS